MNDEEFLTYTKRDAEIMHAMFCEFARIEQAKRRARIIRAAIITAAILLALLIAWRFS